MLAARRRPGKLPEGFYAAAEKEADRAMHTAVRKESRPRPRPLSNKTDWSHAKIKIGPRHQASLPRLDRRRPPPAEGRGGSFVEDPAALEREMAIRGKDWSPETSQKFERAVRKYGDDLDKIRKSVGTRLRRVVARYFLVVGDPDPNTDDEDDAGIIAVDEDESRLVAEFLEELRRGLGPTAHAEALATLRRYDQGLLSEKQVARSMDRLFARGRDDDLRDAFRYFLPAELAV
ncbi:unnamed protein product [Pelagomonas calceolata]|uniref:Myb-like domain-containing protein n=1 Tax=Pelagomonas calceolata TaxID=35677 RepID=A0A8J2WVU4_9STRA|nr:unnamed protein product [Pelagomonas calceolata]